MHTNSSQSTKRNQSPGEMVDFQCAVGGNEEESESTGVQRQVGTWPQGPGSLEM